MDKTIPATDDLMDHNRSSNLPYVPIYLVGNSHLCSHHNILKNLRNLIHPNALIEMLARPGSTIDRRFHGSLDIVLEKEKLYDSDQDAIIVLLTFDNDLRKGSDPNHLVQSVLRRYHQMVGKAPKLRFVICGVMPSLTISEQVALQLDCSLRTQCDFIRNSNDSHIYFLSIRECLKVNNSFGYINYFNRDKVHLNHNGGRKVAEQLACTLNPLIQTSLKFDPPIMAIEAQHYFCYQEDVHGIRSDIQTQGSGNYILNSPEAEIEKGLLQIFGLPAHLCRYQPQNSDNPKLVLNPSFFPHLAYSVINGNVIPHAQIGYTNTRHIQSLKHLTCYCNPKLVCFLCKGHKVYPKSR